MALGIFAQCAANFRNVCAFGSVLHGQDRDGCDLDLLFLQALRIRASILVGVPSGLVLSYTMRPLQPTTRITVSASSRIVTSEPVPMLISGPSKPRSIRNTQASAKSSTYRNSRRGLLSVGYISPTPQRRRPLQRQRSHILMKNAIARPQPLAIFFAMPSSVQANGHACTNRPHPTHQVPP